METIMYRVILGLYRDNGKRKWKLLCIGLYWGYIEIMENKMETTMYRVILGLHRDNGKENGNYRNYRGYVGVIQGCAFRV